jgi:diguanylate cyclase (GGDEF)-like protein/PAS domain S-box-containing protein
MSICDETPQNETTGTGSPSGRARSGRRKRAGLDGFDVRVAANFAHATNLALVSVDSDGIIRFVNRAATKLLGYGEGEMIGEPVEIIIPERFRAAHSSGFARAVAGETLHLGGRPVEIFACRKNGSEFPIELTLCTWHDGRSMAAGAVIKDISGQREREARLLRLASRDVLTGLYNRNGFTQAVADALALGGPVAVALLDLDGFKDINDMHGHAVGDCLLQSIAVRLELLSPAEAEIARFGSDEFALLLRQVEDVAAASAIAEAVMAAFASPFQVNGHVLDIGASGGLAISPDHGAEAEELIASADQAMHGARAGGSRALKIYDPAMRDDAAARRALRDELMLALRRGELVLHYQPQMRLASGEIFGLEALIRWQHPTRGLLQPGAFLPALEQSALALEIGWWTLDEACRASAILAQAGRAGIKMGVNLFPGQLHSQLLQRKVVEALARHDVRPDLLELEVTETTALHDDDKSLEAMTALRAIGVSLAFDDFGTGFASLSSLQRYPLTTLKIDRGFVKNLLARPRDAAITRALIGMSRDLGLETIVEGIETAEQEAFVAALGCPAAQGYRYGKPMPLDEIVTFLSARPRISQCVLPEMERSPR